MSKSGAYLLPSAGGVGFAGGVHGLLEEVQLDQGGRQPAPVGDVLEHDAGRVVQPLCEAAVSHALQVGLVRPRDELLQGAHLACLGIRIHQLCVHLQCLHVPIRKLGNPLYEHLIDYSRRAKDRQTRHSSRGAIYL